MATVILRPLWALVFAIAITVLHAGVPAKAQESTAWRSMIPIICDEREKLASWLEERHNEEIRATGIQDSTGFPVQLWLAPDGSFSITFMMDDNTLCLAMVGTKFKLGAISPASGSDL